jgi:glyoxylase-like metal-dependent hydrolase (beta-lactamase superfamily II)
MQFHTRRVGPLENNVIVLTDDAGTEAMLVDPAWGSEILTGWARDIGVSIKFIVDTHGHFDHSFHNALWRENTGAKLLYHQDDEFMLARQSEAARMWGAEAPDSPPADQGLRGVKALKLGREEIALFHCPGHSPGSVCLYTPDAHEGHGLLLSGDVLFRRSIGRTDLPGGDYGTLLRSIRERLLTLPEETLVIPGHGEHTRIGEEKEENHFLTGGYF